MKTLFPLIALFVATSAFAKPAALKQLKEDVDFASEALGDNCTIKAVSRGDALEIRAADDKTEVSVAVEAKGLTVKSHDEGDGSFIHSYVAGSVRIEVMHQDDAQSSFVITDGEKSVRCSMEM